MKSALSLQTNDYFIFMIYFVLTYESILSSI